LERLQELLISPSGNVAADLINQKDQVSVKEGTTSCHELLENQHSLHHINNHYRHSTLHYIGHLERDILK
jgi:hypothetical protein